MSISSSRPALSVRGLAKAYTIEHQGEQPATMAEALVNRLKRPFHRPDREQFWALQDVSFDIGKGEVVGIIGRNGAGKSTLLKILSRITAPTKGEVRLYGRVGSLLEVGTGFHPELTGRENIFLNGAILGMTGPEIQREFDDIVQFAEIEQFLDTPVKRYSSGMYVRLAFAVAAHLHPEILIVDEVLSVGDAAFQKKCLGKMEDVATKGGRTVLFVSHNVGAIRALCQRVIIMKQGAVAMDGSVDQSIDAYLEKGSTEQPLVAGAELDARATQWLPYGEPRFRCHEISLRDSAGELRRDFWSDEDVLVWMDVEFLLDAPDVECVVVLRDSDEKVLLRSELTDSIDPNQVKWGRRGRRRVECRLPANLFGQRRFCVSVYLVLQNVQHVSYVDVLDFDVAFRGYNGSTSPHSGQAYFRPKLGWVVDACSG